MLYIGNIITSSNLNIGKEFRIVQTIDDADASLPILIIGWEIAKKNIPSFNILTKEYHINDMCIFWTFKKNERKSEYEQDIENFKQYCYRSLLDKIKYQYLDISFFNIKNVKYFLKFIYSTQNTKYFYYLPNKKFLFIYNPANRRQNTICGLSLSLCQYIGINIENLMSKIKANKYNKVTVIPHYINNTFKQFLYAFPHIVPFIEAITKGNNTTVSTK